MKLLVTVGAVNALTITLYVYAKLKSTGSFRFYFIIPACPGTNWDISLIYNLNIMLPEPVVYTQILDVTSPTVQKALEPSDLSAKRNKTAPRTKSTTE